MPPRQRRTPEPAGADATPRTRRRRRLAWYDTDMGSVPDCPDCQKLLFSPMFVEAVYSVSIETPGDPVDLARSTVTAYHDNDHGEV